MFHRKRTFQKRTFQRWYILRKENIHFIEKRTFHKKHAFYRKRTSHRKTYIS